MLIHTEASMKNNAVLNLGGHEYVVVPRAQYDQLLALAGKSADTRELAVDAVAFAMKRIGANVRAARTEAGLTQIELAKRLGKSQSLIAGIEAGRVKAGEEYVRSVLAACGLPKRWKAKRSTT